MQEEPLATSSLRQMKLWSVQPSRFLSVRYRWYSISSRILPIQERDLLHLWISNLQQTKMVNSLHSGAITMWIMVRTQNLEICSQWDFLSSLVPVMESIPSAINQQQYLQTMHGDLLSVLTALRSLTWDPRLRSTFWQPRWESIRLICVRWIVTRNQKELQSRPVIRRKYTVRKICSRQRVHCMKQPRNVLLRRM